MAAKTEPTTNPDFISTQVSKGDYFFLDLKPDFKSPFSVTCGGLETCTTSYIVERKKFDYCGMEYILSGKCLLTLGKKEYVLGAGSVFFYHPSLHHRIENIGKNDLNKYFVDFVSSDVESTNLNPFLLDPQPYQMPNIRVINDLFFQLLEVGKKESKNRQSILEQVIKLIATHVEENAINYSEYQSQSYSTFERCFSCLESNFLEFNSITQLAEQCGVSIGYLSRIFRKYADEKPSNTLIRLKMNRAAELLLKENYLIKEVADYVGIEDPYHFSRLFKNFFGVSPKFFRSSLNRS